jgi:hypothetical protein
MLWTLSGSTLSRKSTFERFEMLDIASAGVAGTGDTGSQNEPHGRGE